MARIRTFIAIESSPEVQGRANDLIRKLQASQAKVSWTKRENMHVTLKFLGDTDESLIPDVCRQVAEAASQFGPLRLEFNQAGAFPSITRPRTLWLGVTHGAEQVSLLQADIEQRLARLRFRREHRRFKPHLTIGRVRGGGPEQEALGQLLAAHQAFAPARCEVDEVLVFASYLAPSGPTYQVLATVPLSAAEK